MSSIQSGLSRMAESAGVGKSNKNYNVTSQVPLGRYAQDDEWTQRINPEALVVNKSFPHGINSTHSESWKSNMYSSAKGMNG